MRSSAERRTLSSNPSSTRPLASPTPRSCASPVIRSQKVRQRVFEGLEWDALHEHFDEITAGGYSVSVFTRWGSVDGSLRYFDLM